MIGLSVEEKLKALAENPRAGPPWTAEDQAHHINTFKADLAGLLKGDLKGDLSFKLEKLSSNVNVLHDLSLLMLCLDALRGELIAWCETKR